MGSRAAKAGVVSGPGHHCRRPNPQTEKVLEQTATGSLDRSLAERRRDNSAAVQKAKALRFPRAMQQGTDSWRSEGVALGPP